MNNPYLRLTSLQLSQIPAEEFDVALFLNAAEIKHAVYWQNHGGIHPHARCLFPVQAVPSARSGDGPAQCSGL